MSVAGGVIFLAISVAASGPTAERFRGAGIAPDVVDISPTAVVTVRYPSAKVVLGNALSPRATARQPRVCWGAEHNRYYTLAMIDPDAPSRAVPVMREFKHWLVVNIPGGSAICERNEGGTKWEEKGNAVSCVEIEKVDTERDCAEGSSDSEDSEDIWDGNFSEAFKEGNTLAPYFPPTPPPHSGPHRYVFLVYVQPKILDFDEPILTDATSTIHRVRFSIRKFAVKYDLGHPVAGNFFFGEFGGSFEQTDN